MQDHPSLTSIDFSNTDNNKNRNNLGNKGFESLLDGISSSKQPSLISMINVAGNCITKLDKLPDIIENIISLDLSNNDIGSTVFSVLKNENMQNLVELRLESTNVTNKSLIDLGLSFKDHKQSMQILDLSNNKITSEGFSKLLSALRTNTSLKKLSFAGNDFQNYGPLYHIE